MGIFSAPSRDEYMNDINQLRLQTIKLDYQIQVTQTMTQASADSLAVLSDKIDSLMTAITEVVSGKVAKKDIVPYLEDAQKSANDDCTSKLNAIMQDADEKIASLHDEWFGDDGE